MRIVCPMSSSSSSRFPFPSLSLSLVRLAARILFALPHRRHKLAPDSCLPTSLLLLLLPLTPLRPRHP